MTELEEQGVFILNNICAKTGKQNCQDCPEGHVRNLKTSADCDWCSKLHKLAAANPDGRIARSCYDHKHKLESVTKQWAKEADPIGDTTNELD